MVSKKSTPKKKSLKVKRLCYVIMPFSKHVGIDETEWTDVYETIFKPAIEGSGFGYRCERSTITSGSFTKEIVENMKNAHVVLADITGFNGNVMWELGVRHALAKRTILVARKDVMSEKIISDLSTYGVIPYDPTNLTKATQFKQDIKDVLKKIDTDPDRSDNPVFDFLKQEEIIQLRFENTKNIKKLSGLITELIENYRIAELILNKKSNVKKDVLTRNRYSTQGSSAKWRRLPASLVRDWPRTQRSHCR